ncbi:MAG TPA: hypothetical protein VLG50_04870 [Candidatus Saccharimonadales bacterium]|nr:hypothetical protein [Candidatus Saccharimonadales bacterium]
MLHTSLLVSNSRFDEKSFGINIETLKDEIPKTVIFLENMRETYPNIFDGITFAVASTCEIIKPIPTHGIIFIDPRAIALIENDSVNSLHIIEWLLIRASYLVSMKNVFICVLPALGAVALSAYGYCKATGYLPKMALNNLGKTDPLFIANENRSWANAIMHGTALFTLVGTTFLISEGIMWSFLNTRADAFVAKTCLNKESFALIYEEYEKAGLDDKALLISQAFKDKFGYELTVD